jgi:hypothetical protein
MAKFQISIINFQPSLNMLVNVQQFLNLLSRILNKTCNKLKLRQECAEMNQYNINFFFIICGSLYSIKEIINGI